MNLQKLSIYIQYEIIHIVHEYSVNKHCSQNDNEDHDLKFQSLSKEKRIQEFFKMTKNQIWFEIYSFKDPIRIKISLI